MHAQLRVTGNMRPINWKTFKDKLKHLNNINFPKLVGRLIVDILIGIDSSELHFSLKDEKSDSGKQIARLTPHGWTCIGNSSSYECTQYIRSYFANKTEEFNQRTDKLLRSFWKIENSATEGKQVMTKEDEKVMSMVKTSKKWVDGKYEVIIPLKNKKLKYKMII